MQKSTRRPPPLRNAAILAGFVVNVTASDTELQTASAHQSSSPHRRHSRNVCDTRSRVGSSTSALARRELPDFLRFVVGSMNSAAVPREQVDAKASELSERLLRQLLVVTEATRDANLGYGEDFRLATLEEQEQARFHEEFVKAMRAQAAETARREDALAAETRAAHARAEELRRRAEDRLNRDSASSTGRGPPPRGATTSRRRRRYWS